MNGNTVDEIDMPPGRLERFLINRPATLLALANFLALYVEKTGFSEMTA